MEKLPFRSLKFPGIPPGILLIAYSQKFSGINRNSGGLGPELHIIHSFCTECVAFLLTQVVTIYDAIAEFICVITFFSRPY